MPRALTGREVIAILAKAGFAEARQNGSHVILKRENGQPGTVSVPVHSNRDLATGTLRKIIRQSGLSPEEFWDLDG